MSSTELMGITLPPSHRKYERKLLRRDESLEFVGIDGDLSSAELMGITLRWNWWGFVFDGIDGNYASLEFVGIYGY